MFNVYIANLGKYNEGELVGEWLSLPATKEEWESLLVKIKLGYYENNEFHYGYEEDGILYEEWAIHDTDTSYNIKVGEYNYIQELNYLAAALENSEIPDTVIEWLDNYNATADHVELINALLQENEVPVFGYDFPGCRECINMGMSDEELYGRDRAYWNGITEIIEDNNLECYFDYEHYGKDAMMNENIVLLDGEYLNMDYCNIDLSYYTYEEIEDEFKDYKIF